MADYTTVRGNIQSMSQAAAVLPYLQDIYKRSQIAQGAINLYTAGTDAAFNEAIDSIFTANERNQLAEMLTDLNTLVTEWSTNHAVLLATGVTEG